MKKNKLNENELVFIKKENAYTTSLIVSEYFGKEHYHVVRDIENLDCSKDFFASNFGGIKYTDEKGRKQKAYKIKKDGLVFLIMGYRGKKASELKEKYIQQFNKMEKLIEEKQTPEYQQLRFYDITHQKSQMKKLATGVKDKSPIKYIKANTIADKAIAKKYGYKKSLKKEDMTKEMIEEREKILEQITALMIAQSLGINIPHISDVIYNNI